MTTTTNGNPIMIPGIDVSKWQGNTWDSTKAIANGVKWMYIRAYNGTTIDSSINYYVKKAVAAKIPFGFYSYFLPKQDAVKQGKMLADITKKYKATLVPMYDIEESIGLTTLNVEAYIQTCDKAIGQNGVVYTSAEIWDKQVLSTKFSSHALWIPRYPSKQTPPVKADQWDKFAFTLKKDPVVPKAWKTWDIWQFSANENKAATNYGFPVGDLDLDIMFASSWDKMVMKPSTTPVKPNATTIIKTVFKKIIDAITKKK